MLTYNGNKSRQKTIKLGRHMNDRKSYELFRNVIYILDESLPELVKTRLRKLLLNNGGTPGAPLYDENSQNVPKDTLPNLYVSQDKLYPHSNENIVHSVTPLWVEKAVSLGFVHNLSYYSPVLKQFLSGVVLLLLDLPDEDSSSIKNEIKRFGGQYRDDISEDITHLICLDPRGAQYKQCVEQNIPAVLPQWLDDCFRFKRKMETELYRFPNPIVYYENSMNVPKLFSYYDKDALTLTHKDDYNMVFEDEVFYFGKDISFKDDFKQILVNAIVKAGGSVLDQYSHQYVTIVILKYRSSHECRMASKDKKLIASLWWVVNTLSRKYYCSPLSTLLDYPTPPGGLPGMENNVISIAGYGNIKRYYLRRLLLGLGARYDPGLTSNTTHLICGRTSSDKYIEAKKRSKNIIIINHIWLEDCFQQWKLLDCSVDDRYKFIPKEEKKLLAACAGKLHLLDTELQRWMEPSTTPTYITTKYLYNQNLTDDEKGSFNVRKRRKAAVAATSMLNAIMPDANAYEKERTKQNYR